MQINNEAKPYDSINVTPMLDLATTKIFGPPNYKVPDNQTND